MLIVTAVYWVSEAVPLGAAALVPAFLYPFFGVLRSSEVRPLAAQPPARGNARPVGEGSRWKEMHKALEEEASSPREHALSAQPLHMLPGPTPSPSSCPFG